MSGNRLAHERAQLIHGLNGHEVDADTAWAIIHRWDALVEIAEAAPEVLAALDDAIKAAVNAEWTQEDYDAWDAARRIGEAALAGLDSGAAEDDGVYGDWRDNPGNYGE